MPPVYIVQNVFFVFYSLSSSAGRAPSHAALLCMSRMELLCRGGAEAQPYEPTPRQQRSFLPSSPSPRKHSPAPATPACSLSPVLHGNAPGAAPRMPPVYTARSAPRWCRSFFSGHGAPAEYRVNDEPEDPCTTVTSGFPGLFWGWEMGDDDDGGAIVCARPAAGAPSDAPLWGLYSSKLFSARREAWLAAKREEEGNKIARHFI